MSAANSFDPGSVRKTMSPSEQRVVDREDRRHLAELYGDAPE